MKTKLLDKVLSAAILLLLVIGCVPTEDGDLITEEPLEIVSISPEDNSTEMPVGATAVTLEFNQDVLIADRALIDINGAQPTIAYCVNHNLEIEFRAESDTKYTITVGKGAVKTVKGTRSTEEYTLSITTKEEAVRPPSITDRSPEATRLMDYLTYDVAGQKMLSGTMATSDWNINEAKWVYKHTGKWPAINGFDYLHFNVSSSGNWIDYENISPVEDWWNAGGIATIMWHWNVLANNGSDYTCSPGSDPEETSFDVGKINHENSTEYKQMVADIDKVAGYLKLLKAKNIPVLWRPLHEAAGNYYANDNGAGWAKAWFWWGSDGPESFKKLWQLMYDRFTNIHGLDNLIWIWTYEPEGYAEWYPGDAYVDITGSDIYDSANSSNLAGRYTAMNTHFSNKPAVLAECGNPQNDKGERSGDMALMSAQWEAGARWAYFMTWYDYSITNNPDDAEAFNRTVHKYADVSWWVDAFGCEFVVSRDKLPDFK